MHPINQSLSRGLEHKQKTAVTNLIKSLNTKIDLLSNKIDELSDKIDDLYVKQKPKKRLSTVGE